MKKYFYLLVTFLLLGYFQSSFGAIVEVPCSSRPYYSNSCNQCFIQNTPVYLGHGSANMSDTWNAGTAGEYMYFDKNANPVNIRPFYTQGELQKGTGGFQWSSNLVDGNANNGEIYTDEYGDKFIRFLPSTSGKILQADATFYMRFANVSNGVISNGRNYPLWETQYSINYYNIGNWTLRNHTECVLNYPAWCGDGTLTNGEICDPNDLTRTGWGTGGCNDTCQPITPTCNNLSISPLSGTGGNTFSFTGTLNSLIPSLSNSYINITGSGYNNSFSGNTLSILGSSLTGTGNYTATFNFFSGSQLIPGEGPCQQTFSITSIITTGGSSGGGSPDPACYLDGSNSPFINVSTGSTASGTCYADVNFGPIRTQQELIIGGRSYSVGDIIDGNTITSTGLTASCQRISIDDILNNNIGNYSSCGLNIISNSGNNGTIRVNTTCNQNTNFNLEFAGKWDDNGGACYTEYSSSSSSGGSNYCGDGILQRPNSSGLMEECDFGNGTWPAWCQKTTCEILENTTPGGLTDSNSSTPSGGAIVLSPGNSLLLGGGMGVFEYLTSNNAYIQNNSTSDIYIDKKLCVYKNGFEYNAMNGTNICSNGEVGFLSKNGGKKNLYVADDKFVANISSMPSTKTYVDGEIITTLEGLQSTNSFLKSILKVRVAKPTVNTIGGGASLLKGTNYSDVNNLSQGMGPLNPAVNKNLILTSLGVNPLSSYVKSSNDSSLILKSKTEGNNDLSAFDNIETNQSKNTITFLPNENFNGLDNVFVHKGNVTLSSQNISTGNKTYIIEDGDLTINGNLSSSGNILFVVKNGDLIIKNSVTKIDAVLINIGGNISGEATSTTTRLVINGALYGKVDDLLSKRTYIKDRGEYVDVGTNVNFTSKIFDSPPPLLSQFLGEYLKGDKIPK